MNREYCFCTLAFGKSYRECALLLASDLQKYAPDAELIVLTDKVEFFAGQSNIRAFWHEPLSCKIYHDKKYILVKALSFYPSCIFLDANIRVKNRVPTDINFKEGLVAYSRNTFLKLFYKENKSDPNHPRYGENNRRFQSCQHIASYYGIDLNRAKFIFEGIFYATKNNNFKEFINYWNAIGDYFESKGFYDIEGMAIGLAAAIANFPIHYDDRKKISIFKDVLENHKIKMGQASYEQNKQYFQDLQEIENPQSSLLDKIKRKIEKKAGFYYRLSRLKIRILQYKDLFANFDRTPVIELKDIDIEAVESASSKI